MAAVVLQGLIATQSDVSAHLSGPVHLKGFVEASASLKGYFTPTYGPFEPESDHVGTGLDRIIEKLKDQPKFKGLVQSFLNQIQDIEDALWSIKDGYDIYQAVGTQLDTLGVIVGEKREGLDDETYRAMLFVRILLNKCQANMEDILTIFERFYPAAQYSITQYYPAMFDLRVIGKMPETPSVSRFYRVLQAAKGAGIRADLTYQTVNESSIKKFDTAGQGFDSGKFLTTMV